jgi:hypothetical protein
MSTTDKAVLVILAIAIAVILIFARTSSDPCGAAEFGPDVPVHIKEQCRQHRRIKT